MKFIKSENDITEYRRRPGGGVDDLKDLPPDHGQQAASMEPHLKSRNQFEKLNAA